LFSIFFLGIWVSQGKKGAKKKKKKRGGGKFHLDNVPLEIFCCCLMSLGSFNAWFKKVRGVLNHVGTNRSPEYVLDFSWGILHCSDPKK
jgi:hypothetical protein